jgi:protease-4
MSRSRIALFIVVVVAVLGVMVLLATVALRTPVPRTPASTVLVFDVPEELDEAQAPAGGGLFGLVSRERETVYELADGLRQAADDPKIKALVLHIDGLDWGWAKVADIREAVTDFRSSGKPVYASFEGGGAREYVLASAAGTIAAPPLAVLELNGLTASALFMRGTLDKVGVTPNFAQAGKYKSAVEAWTKTGMTGPAREALQALVDDQYEVVVDTLASARGMSTDSVMALIDNGPYGAREARAAGLVDTLLHRAELDSMAIAATGAHRSTLSLNRYVSRLASGSADAHIALVMAAGTIAEGKSRNSASDGEILGAETLIKALREVRNRSSVEAIVLRVDSPGGSAQASDEIWEEVRRCAERKPVIASFSDLAASGGYYIAVPADTIVAEPGTLTGSIGAFGGKLNLLGLYHKLGLNVETVSRGRHAEMFSPFKDFTPEEAQRFQQQMDEVYRVFVSRVAEGRGLSTGEVDSVGQGRVWTGLSALDLGLVDVLGGLPEAFAIARSMAGIDEDASVEIEVYPRVDRPFFQRLFSDLWGDEDQEAQAALPPVVRAWLAAARFPTGAPLTLMPWSIDIR